jgi:hypothetical protein
MKPSCGPDGAASPEGRHALPQPKASGWTLQIPEGATKGGKSIGMSRVRQT